MAEEVRLTAAKGLCASCYTPEVPAESLVHWRALTEVAEHLLERERASFQMKCAPGVSKQEWNYAEEMRDFYESLLRDLRNLTGFLSCIADAHKVDTRWEHDPWPPHPQDREDEAEPTPEAVQAEGSQE